VGRRAWWGWCLWMKLGTNLCGGRESCAHPRHPVDPHVENYIGVSTRCSGNHTRRPRHFATTLTEPADISGRALGVPANAQVRGSASHTRPTRHAGRGVSGARSFPRGSTPGGSAVSQSPIKARTDDCRTAVLNDRRLIHRSPFGSATHHGACRRCSWWPAEPGPPSDGTTDQPADQQTMSRTRSRVREPRLGLPSRASTR
jgi:hypothetical protein